MPRIERLWMGTMTVVLVLACDRDARSPATDSVPVVPPAPVDTGTSALPRATWDAALGPVLVIAGESEGTASIIFPTFSDSTLTDTTTFDTSSLAGLRLDLFSHAGLVGRGRLQPRAPRRRDDGCVTWPDALIRVDSGGSNVGWMVGLASGRAGAFELDSLEDLSRSDSARITVEVARLASTLPNDTATSFHGIPFFVRQVRRFRIPGSEILVANITRRINQEANPREEQLLLVAERETTSPAMRYSPVYHERVSGHEEAIETTDVLTALTLGADETPAVLLIRDYGDGSAYALLNRVPGRWGIGWSSAYAGC